MPRYANFDHTAPAPSPVIGWYDTDFLTYPTLPDATDLLEMSDAQWDARMSGFWAVSAGSALVSYTPPPPPLTPEQTLDLAIGARIAMGIAITSTGTPALSATYALDPETMVQVGSVARDASSGLGLPGDAASFTYPDITGAPHSFTEAQIIALYRAQRNLLLALNEQLAILAHGGSPSWPAQSKTIA